MTNTVELSQTWVQPFLLDSRYLSKSKCLTTTTKPGKKKKKDCGLLILFFSLTLENFLGSKSKKIQLIVHSFDSTVVISIREKHPGYVC